MTIFIVGEAMLEYHSGGALGGLRYGGDTLNTAIHMARMGMDVAYVTALGSDPISDALIDLWQGEGIDTRFVLRHPDRNPGIYAINVDSEGERSFLYWRNKSAASDMFSLPKIGAAMNAASRGHLLYYSLITLAILPPSARGQLFDTARSVKAGGGMVAYDSNFRASLWRSLSGRAAGFERGNCTFLCWPANEYRRKRTAWTRAWRSGDCRYVARGGL